MALSHDNVIIVAVFSAVGALVVVAVVVRVVRRGAVASNPLPPVQPLAHHREQQQQLRTWHAPPFGSRASLITKNPPSPAYTDESASPARDTSRSLHLPTPFFHPARPASAASLTSSDHSAPDPEPSAHPPSSFSSPPGRRPARPVSTASTHSTPSRHNTIRGTPHGPHSQVQIILPTPLSPELSSPDLRGLTRTPDLSRRRSVVDQWVSGTAHAEPLPSSAASTLTIARPSPRRAVSASYLATEGHYNTVAE